MAHCCCGNKWFRIYNVRSKMNVELTRTLEYDEGVENSVPSKFPLVVDLPKSHPNNDAFCELGLLPRELVRLCHLWEFFSTEEHYNTRRQLYTRPKESSRNLNVRYCFAPRQCRSPESSSNSGIHVDLDRTPDIWQANSDWQLFNSP